VILANCSAFYLLVQLWLEPNRAAILIPEI
jgi:hypothetical protein